MVITSSSSGASTPVTRHLEVVGGRGARVIPLNSPRRRRRARPEWEGRSLITVAALPGRSLHVKHLGHPEGVDGVHRPTVLPPGSGRRTGGVFDPAWLQAHLDDIDVVDVESVPARLSPQDVARAAELVRAAGKPLVVTAYHLSDPTGTAEDNFAAQLDELIPRADAVVTLTETAAGEIRRRWGVDAVILPHPHAVDFVRMRQERTPTRPDHLRVGSFLGSLQGVGIDEFVVSLSEAAARTPGAQLTVFLHEHVLDPVSQRYDVERARAIERAVRDAGGTLRAHRPLTDAQLWDALFNLDVAVLPPLCGSHSVIPEAGFDLGTQTVVPARTAAADQQESLTWSKAASSLPNALKAAAEIAAADEVHRAVPTERWDQRMRISEGYRNLYERVLGR